jgi:hypothetical protein
LRDEDQEQSAVEPAEDAEKAGERQPGQHQQQHLVEPAQELADDDLAREQAGGEQVLQAAANLLVADGARDQCRREQDEHGKMLQQEPLQKSARELDEILFRSAHPGPRTRGDHEERQLHDQPARVDPAQEMAAITPAAEQQFLMQHRPHLS